MTVSPGIEVGATGRATRTGDDLPVRDRGDGTPPATPATTFQFSDDLFESATKDRPIIAVWAFQDTDDEEDRRHRRRRAPRSRSTGSTASTPRWTPIAASAPYPRWSRLTSSRPRPDHRPDPGLRARRPPPGFRGRRSGPSCRSRLPAGWYLIQLASPTRPIQAMLQVTDIASYLVVSETKTLLWANDLATGGPLAGAVGLGGRRPISAGPARTGRLSRRRPPSVVPAPLGTCADPCVALITVRDGDRSSFVPASEPSRPRWQGRVGWDSDQSMTASRTGTPSTPTARCIGRPIPSTPGGSSAIATAATSRRSSTISLAAIDSDTGDGRARRS